jgi:hypothetical protein
MEQVSQIWELVISSILLSKEYGCCIHYTNVVLNKRLTLSGLRVPAHPCHITVEVYPRLPQAGVTAAPALGQSKFSQKNKMNLTGKFILMELFKLKKNF